MPGAMLHSLSYLAITVPHAERTLFEADRSRESSVQLAILIGFAAIFIVMGILMSGPPREERE